MKQLNAIIVHILLITICISITSLQNTNYKNNILTYEDKDDIINDIEIEVIQPYSTLVAEVDVFEAVEEIEEAMPVYDIPLSKELQEFTYDKCKEYEVPYELILAIFKTESNFNIKAKNKNSNGSVDRGIGQINSIHKKEFNKQGFTDWFNPYENIEYSVKYFAELYHKFDGNEHYSLSSYNRGEWGFRKLLKKGITSTKYSRAVINNKNKITQYKEGDIYE